MTAPVHKNPLYGSLPAPVVHIERDGVIRLPICPSTNNLFKNAIGRGRVRSDEYKRWQESAGLILNRQRPASVASPVAVSIRVGKCNQARDLDNVSKPILDLLAHHGVIHDDNLNNVHKITITKAFGDVAEGWLEVTAEHIGGVE